jgi:hypothetical protein
MDIGSSDLPILPMRPGEGIRRVEGRADAQQQPPRRQPQDEQPEDGDREPRHDSVDVSATYWMAKPEHTVPTEGDAPLTISPTVDGERHLDIEA